MFRSGYLSLSAWNGVPVRIHWTAPVAIVLFGGALFRPGYWIALLLLILVHELGHAFCVRVAGQRVVGIELSLIGGLCRWQGAVSGWQRVLIAWGGVAAQLLALGTAVLATALAGPWQDPYAADFASTWTRANLWIMAFNLLPFAPLDGYEGWKALPLLRDAVQAQLYGRRRRRRSAEVHRLAADLEQGRISADLKAQLDHALGQANAVKETEEHGTTPG